MKCIFSFVVITGFSIAANAQSDITLEKNYHQKQFLDSLRKTFKQPTIQINPQPLLAYHTPVVPMKNDGEMIGLSGEDTVYKMKTDNMHVLKPNTKTTYIPNAAEGKIFMMPAEKKKP